MQPNYCGARVCMGWLGGSTGCLLTYCHQHGQTDTFPRDTTHTIPLDRGSRTSERTIVQLSQSARMLTGGIGSPANGGILVKVSITPAYV
ncbi:hypothetical protein PYCC9005_002608 [Savitreella phatthalungensis]